MSNRFLSLVLALTLSAAAFAQKGRVAPADAQPCATRLITEIKWNDDLQSMLAEARKENKLVFYMHMLGKIGGDT